MKRRSCGRVDMSMQDVCLMGQSSRIYRGWYWLRALTKPSTLLLILHIIQGLPCVQTYNCGWLDVCQPSIFLLVCLYLCLCMCLALPLQVPVDGYKQKTSRHALIELCFWKDPASIVLLSLTHLSGPGDPLLTFTRPPFPPHSACLTLSSLLLSHHPLPLSCLILSFFPSCPVSTSLSIAWCARTDVCG